MAPFQCASCIFGILSKLHGVSGHQTLSLPMLICMDAASHFLLDCGRLGAAICVRNDVLLSSTCPCAPSMKSCKVQLGSQPQNPVLHDLSSTKLSRCPCVRRCSDGTWLSRECGNGRLLIIVILRPQACQAQCWMQEFNPTTPFALILRRPSS